MGLAECSMADGDKARVGWPHRVGPVVPSDQSRHIGSGEAASYRRLPPPEPPKALSWHVPLPVLMGPLWNRLLTGAVPFLGTYLAARSIAAPWRMSASETSSEPSPKRRI